MEEAPERRGAVTRCGKPHRDRVMQPEPVDMQDPVEPNESKPPDRKHGSSLHLVGLVGLAGIIAFNAIIGVFGFAASMVGLIAFIALTVLVVRHSPQHRENDHA